MTKKEMAINFHKRGFNCAQSVVLPFCDELGLDPVAVAKGMEGFGAGMGGFELTCGALSGAIYVAGILNSDGDLDNPSSKRDTYNVCKHLCSCFKDNIGSNICKEIKGIESGNMLKSCNECILFGVELIEKMLSR